MKIRRQIATALVGSSLVLGVAGMAAAKTGTGDMMMELKRLVERQQQQLDQQASEIAELREQLSTVSHKTKGKRDKEEFEKVGVDKMVTSKNKNVDVELYGQVNRAGLWADNGDSSKVYFVDNEASSTRLGLKARAQATDDVSIGGRIEYELVSNSSADVNQLEPDTGTELNLRWADVDFKSNKFGTLFLGRGSTFSDGTAEHDLSGTKIVTYSKVHALAGGQLWYDSRNNELTELQVKQSFNNLDGLSRKDRLRYDTPSFAGITLGGSAVEGGALDAGLKYARKFDGAKVAGAIAWSDPQDLKDSVDYTWDGSLSVLLDMGLNFTLAGGQENRMDDNRDDANYWYSKIGYKASLFSPGITAFVIDYGQYNYFAANNDEGKTFGVGFVQNVKDWGTEFYLAYRLYQLERDNTDFDDVNSVMTGARLKF